MLVLTRQLDEGIMIGDDVVITVVDIIGNKVRLGIAAPSEIPVHRQEVYETIQRENFSAMFAARPADAEPTKPRLVDPASFRRPPAPPGQDRE